MKLFQTVQKNFAVLGIGRGRSKTNRKLVFTWLILSLTVAAGTAFIVFEAKTFEEYTSDLYTTSGDAVVASMFMVIKMDRLFELIDMIEQAVDESELDLNLFFEI